MQLILHTTRKSETKDKKAEAEQTTAIEIDLCMSTYILVHV